MSFTRSSFFALSLAVLGALPAKAGVFDEIDACSGTFCTDEYKGMGALSKINAENAYEAGFTGKGVTVAVVDSGTLLTHQELAGKISPLQTTELTGKGVGEEIDHGTHVSGIIAAAKDNVEMHGVAFDSSILALGSAITDKLRDRNPDTSVRLTELLDSKYDDIKIINNSWGSNFYLNDYFDQHSDDEETDSDWVAMVKLAKKDKLMIVAAGNEAQDYPGMPAWFPAARYEKDVDDLKLNMINVVSYNPYKTTNDPEFIARYSNLAKGAESFSLAAPGGGDDKDTEGLYSTNSTGNNEYIRKSGTSMATPVVSGVAALVQQAFPYMGGKQIADVLLSTADRSWETNKESFSTLYLSIWDTLERQDDDGSSSGSVRDDNANDNTEKLTANFRFTENLTDESAQRSVVKSTMEVYGITLGDDFKSGDTAEIEDAFGKKTIYTILYGTYTFEELFGAGFVNAEAAVKGVKTLDANRLRESDYDSRQYFYTVDTKGFDSEWSHNIDAKHNSTTHTSALVGLKKEGAGRLILSGNNTYDGDTIVNGGVLDVRGTMRSDMIVNADAELHLNNAGGEFITNNNGLLSLEGDNTSSGVFINGGTLDLGTATLTASSVEFTDSADEKHLKIKINSSTEYGHFLADAHFKTTADGVITTTLHINVDKSANLKAGDEFDFWYENTFFNSVKSDNLQNNLYTFERVDDNFGTYRIASATSVADFMASAGADAAQVQALNAFTSGTMANAKAEAFGQTLFETAQHGTPEQVKRMVASVMPDNQNSVQKATSDNVNRLFAAVRNRVSSVSGRSGGDAFTNASAWGKFLYNHTRADNAFNGHSKGFVIGADAETTNGHVLGIGYSHTDTDLKSGATGADTDITGDSVFAYGQYLNGKFTTDVSVGYTHNTVKENKAYSSDKHSADQYAAQATVGYGAHIVPTAGARYIHTRSNAYMDDLGQVFASTKEDLLTGLLGVGFNAETGRISWSGDVFATYDFISDSDTVSVSLPNGLGYSVKGERSARLGAEAGIAASVRLNNKVALSAEYAGAFKKEFTSHTGMLKLRYDF